jgi:hypothetical protein
MYSYIPGKPTACQVCFSVVLMKLRLIIIKIITQNFQNWSHLLWQNINIEYEDLPYNIEIYWCSWHKVCDIENFKLWRSEHVKNTSNWLMPVTTILD